MTILLLLLLPSSLLATQIGLAASLAHPSPLLGPLTNFLAAAEHEAPIGPSLPEFYQSPPSFFRDTESTGSDEAYVPSQPYIAPEPYMSSDTYLSTPALPEVMPASDYSGQVDYFYGDQDPVYDRQQAQGDLGFEGALHTHVIINQRFTNAKM